MSTRKDPRLEGWDYSKNGAYFLTFCTLHREPTLASIPYSHTFHAPSVRLTPLGESVEHQLHELERYYSWMHLVHYAIMPNHVHLLVLIEDAGAGASGTPPPTQKLVGAGLPDRPNRANQKIPALISTLKRLTNRACGRQLWQRSYYDHIIRDENDFSRIWTYIDNNPKQWELDRYYREGTP